MSGADHAEQSPTVPARIVLEDLFEGFSPPNAEAFQPLWPGIEILPLYGLTPRGEPLARERPSAALLRYAPGASVPLHWHPGFEHIFILEGSQCDELGVYSRGTCVISTPGTRHRVASPEGCLVLAIWTQSVEVLDA